MPAASSSPARLEKGLLHVYTGKGKGKTTAAMGLASRAAGHGLKVIVITFLKEPIAGGERAALERGGLVTFENFGRMGHVNPKHPDPKDVEMAKKGMARAKVVLHGGEWDLVILDEVCVAIQYGLLNLGEVMAALEARAAHVEAVCTGRGAPLELEGIADYVTRMDPLKHPYERGIESRRGIEE